jgi:hypothetical protein
MPVRSPLALPGSSRLLTLLRVDVDMDMVRVSKTKPTNRASETDTTPRIKGIKKSVSLQGRV